MVSPRLYLLLVACLASVSLAQPQKPYAPDLYARAELVQGSGERMARRSIPSARSKNDAAAASSPLSKRSPSPSSAETSAWSPLEFLGMRAYSEEELHARGRVSDEEIEKRGWCGTDAECSSSQYCSSKKYRCYKKLNDGKTCSRNGACKSDYCCATNDECEAKRPVGARCHQNNNACQSDYCSVKTNLCRDKTPVGSACVVDDGCKQGLACVNKTCKTIGSSHGHGHHGGSKPHPHHPSPSGSPWDKRTLRHA